jgi:transposase-like protein
MPKPKQAKPAKADEPFDDKEARVVEIIALGGTIRSAATEIGVDQSTITRWLQDESRVAFRTQYAQAREAQADSFFDEVVDVSRDPTIDPATARVRIDALKWAAGKRKPKVYGDRVQLDQTVTVKPADQMDDNELAAIALGSGAGIAAPSRGSA